MRVDVAAFAAGRRAAARGAAGCHGAENATRRPRRACVGLARERCGAGGLAEDEFRWDHLHEGVGRLFPGGANLLEQKVARAFHHAQRILIDGRERGVEFPPDVEVIEACDRNLARDVHARVAEGVQSAEGNLVVFGEESGRAALLVEDELSHELAALDLAFDVGELRDIDEDFLRFEAAEPGDLEQGGAAPDVVFAEAEETEGVVFEPEQMVHQEAHGLGAIEGDGRHLLRAMRIDLHARQAFERGEGLGAFELRIHEDDAVDMDAVEILDGAQLLAAVAHADLEERLKAVAAEKFLQRVDFPVHDGIAEAHEADADHTGAPAAQAAGERVRAEPELVHGGENALAGAGVYLGVAVDGARDRPGGEVQVSREVGDREDGGAGWRSGRWFSAAAGHGWRKRSGGAARGETRGCASDDKGEAAGRTNWCQRAAVEGGMEQLNLFLSRVLGLNVEPRELEWPQMIARGLVMFIAALLMLRLAHKRFFAQRNALDVLLSLVIASTLARAINGNAAFFPTIVTGFALVLAHRGVTWLAARSEVVGVLVKGKPTPIIEDGRVKDAVLRKHDLSREDLDEDLRINGVESPADVKRATLERNGEVSVVKAGS